MQARRASRELAFLLFSQLKEIPKAEEFEELIIKSTRILIGNARDDLQTVMSALVQSKEAFDAYEADHESNLERPIGTSNKPVPVTSDVSGQLGKVHEMGETIGYALEICEFAALATDAGVRDYTVKIAQAFREHSAEVDEIIQKYANNWNIERLVKMDRDILRIAIVELLYTKDAPMKVVVDEALELAKKYSTDDSTAFINGILAKVIVDYGV